MGQNSTEVAYGFGQLGSVFTDATGTAITPPTDKVFVAVTMLADVTFDTTGGLVAQTKQIVADGANTGKTLANMGFQFPNTAEAAHNAADGSETALEGSGGVIVDASNTFPKGATIYGRWIEIDLTSGMCIAYIGD